VYKAIVVGTDGSERAALAVTHALELAKISEAKLHVIQVVHPALKAGFSDSSGGQLEVDKLRDEAEHRAAQVRAQLVTEADRRGVPTEIHDAAGEDVADTLVKTAEALGADLIVVGNRGSNCSGLVAPSTRRATGARIVGNSDRRPLPVR